MAGTSWMKAPRTPVLKVGIHRSQRFLHGPRLTPMGPGIHEPFHYVFYLLFRQKRNQ